MNNKHIIALITDSNYVSGIFINNNFSEYVPNILKDLKFVENNESPYYELYMLESDNIKETTAKLMKKLNEDLLLDCEKLDLFYCEQKEITSMLEYIEARLKI